MKKYILLLITSLLSLTLANSSTAALVTGQVLCDANHSRNFDTNDVGIPGVLVVITNQSGTFSNATFTAGDGSFSLQIPNFDAVAETNDPSSQVYVETLAHSTLPPGSTIVFPPPVTNIFRTPAYFITFADTTNLVFTSGAGSTDTGDWLINNPGCQSDTCGLSGSGVINDKFGRPAHTFNGTILAADGRDGSEMGFWRDTALSQKLMFQSTEIQTINCSVGTGGQGGSGSMDNIIEFSGVGTLKGFGGNKTNNSMVLFTVQVEDIINNGKNSDRYYIRVYTADGVTLLLVSGDPANPAHIVPVPISMGNLRVNQVH